MVVTHVELLVAVIAAVPGIIAALTGLVALLLHRQSKQIHEIHLMVNDRLTQLLESRHKEGIHEGRELQRSEQAPPAPSD